MLDTQISDSSDPCAEKQRICNECAQNSARRMIAKIPIRKNAPFFFAPSPLLLHAGDQNTPVGIDPPDQSRMEVGAPRLPVLYKWLRLESQAEGYCLSPLLAGQENHGFVHT